MPLALPAHVVLHRVQLTATHRSRIEPTGPLHRTGHPQVHPARRRALARLDEIADAGRWTHAHEEMHVIREDRSPENSHTMSGTCVPHGPAEIVNRSAIQTTNTVPGVPGYVNVELIRSMVRQRRGPFVPGPQADLTPGFSLGITTAPGVNSTGRQPGVA